MIQDLEAAPGLSRRRHINQREQYPRDQLEHETRQRSASENIEPAGSFTRNEVLGLLANRGAQLQPQIEPVSNCLDQAHVFLPRVVLTARPGVGISPAWMRSFPLSI